MLPACSGSGNLYKAGHCLCGGIINRVRMNEFEELSVYLVDEVVGDLASAVAESTSLHVLQTSGAIPTMKDALAMGEALIRSKSLQAVRFFYCDMSTFLEALKPALLKCRVRHLSFIDCNVGSGPAAETLAEVMRDNWFIEELLLTDNHVGCDGASTIGKILRYNRSLRTMCLTNNNIGMHGATVIAEALRHNIGLQRFALADNKFEGAGLAAVFDAIKDNRTLQGLLLFNAHVSDPSQYSAQLQDMLLTNNTLTALDLGSCNLRHVGAAALAVALKKNSSLRILNLMGNNMGNRGALLIAKSLEHNSTLKSLSLAANGITDAKVIMTITTSLDTRYAGLSAEAQRDPPGLTALDVSGNGLEDDAVPALKPLATRLLQALFVSGNNLDPSRLRPRDTHAACCVKD